MARRKQLEVVESWGEPSKVLIPVVKIQKEKPKKKNPTYQRKTVDVDAYTEWINTAKVMLYSDYLDTDHWKHFQTEAVKNAQYHCTLCNKSKVQLHVHHKTYDNRGRETFNDVIVLCKECHEKHHDKFKERESYKPW